MPFFIICGTPDDVNPELLERLEQELFRATNEVSRMGYRGSEMMVSFPADRMKKEIGRKFSISVASLGANIDAGAIRNADRVAHEFCKVVASYFPDYASIQCYTSRFGPNAEGSAVLVKSTVA
jgi:hypothetical protein